MSNYTQPVCDPCWLEEHADWETIEHGNDPYLLVSVPISYSIPTVVRGFPLELCCLCGRHTISGIYVRKNPDSVPYPTIVPDEA